MCAVVEDIDVAPLRELQKELRERMVKHGLPGYAFCVTQYQQPIFIDYHGLRDIERGTPVEISTLFRQYSMTKAVVSVALMTFYDEGRVGLDDDVAKFLGDAWAPASSPEAARGLRVATGDGVLCGAEGEEEALRGISAGDVIHLRAKTTRMHIDADPSGVARCRWDDRGLWQSFHVESLETAAGRSRVALRAHTGKYLDIVDGHVCAASTTPVRWLVSAPGGALAGPLRAGDVVRFQREEGSDWLCVSDPAKDEDTSLAATQDAGAAAEFLLERQSWLMGPPVPAARPITVRQLLTHTSGLSYAGDSDPPVTPLDRLVRTLVKRCEAGEITTLEAWVAGLAEMPLRHQPGTKFEYGWSLDVLGRVVEVLGGAPLDQVLRKRIFSPLDMITTTWGTGDSDARDRLAALYQFKGGLDHGERTLVDDPLSSLWVPPSPIFGGGGGVETLRGGLLSTVPDYMRFCCMLQGGGQFSGERVLKQSTVKLMTEVNHLSLMGIGDGKIFDGRGWGLLGSIELPDQNRLDDPSHNPGAYGWGGWASTSFRVYPDSGFSYVFMTNCIDGGDYEKLILRRVGETIRKATRPRWRALLDACGDMMPWLAAMLAALGALALAPALRRWRTSAPRALPWP